MEGFTLEKFFSHWDCRLIGGGPLVGQSSPATHLAREVVGLILADDGYHDIRYTLRHYDPETWTAWYGFIGIGPPRRP